MVEFYFEHPVKVYSGEGVTAKYLKNVLKDYGKNVMLCFGKGSVKKNGVYDEIINILSEAGKTVIEFSGIMPNPTYKKVQEGANLAKENKIDLVLAVGGGSVVDCCKILCAQAVTDEDVWDMWFVKKQKPKKYLPLISVVTVFGTGAEMNAGGVITNEDKKQKACIYGAFSDFAFLDIKYSMSAPLLQVMSGAFDTFSHCMEIYFAYPTDNNASDYMNEGAMRCIIDCMRKVKVNPNDKEARSDLAWISAMAENGVLKLGKESAFQAHQIEHQLGAYTDCNHGLGLAVISPSMYLKIYRGGLQKFKSFAVNVWGVKDNGDDEETARLGILALRDFIKEVGLPLSLREIGITDKSNFREIANSVNIKKGCFTTLTHEDILEILEEVF